MITVAWSTPSFTWRRLDDGRNTRRRRRGATSVVSPVVFYSAKVVAKKKQLFDEKTQGKHTPICAHRLILLSPHSPARLLGTRRRGTGGDVRAWFSLGDSTSRRMISNRLLATGDDDNDDDDDDARSTARHRARAQKKSKKARRVRIQTRVRRVGGNDGSTSDEEEKEELNEDGDGDRNLRLLTATVCLSMLSFGAATGAIAGALLFLEQGTTALGTLTTASKSLVVAATPLGALFGAVAVSPRLNSTLGRRAALLVTNFVYILGAVVMAASITHTQLVLGRLIAGVAVGVSTSACTLYISECAPAVTRGELASLSPLAGTCGILLSYFASLALSAVDWGWRAMLALCAVPALCQLCARKCLVESPRWLAEKGRSKDAANALARLGQRDVPVASLAAGSAETITSSNSSSNSSDSSSGGGGGGGWSRLLRPECRRATTAAVGLNVLQQLCGINVVVYYAPRILSTLGFARRDSIALTAVIGVLQILCGLGLSRVIDKIGRKPAALGGIVGLGCGLSALAVSAFYSSGAGGVWWAPWLAVCGILVFRLSFSCSLGPVPYVVAAEVFPPGARTTGVAAATGAQWAANVAVTGSFLRLLELLGPTGTWMFYLCMVFAAFFAVRVALPETKGKALEDMDDVRDT